MNNKLRLRAQVIAAGMALTLLFGAGTQVWAGI